MNILLVYKNYIFASAVSNMLEGIHNVATTNTPGGANLIMDHKNIDTLLIEYELIQSNEELWSGTVVENAQKREIPIIMISDTNKKELFLDAMKYKPDSYLIKPVTRKRLIDEISFVTASEVPNHNLKDNSSNQNEEGTRKKIKEILDEMGF